MRLTLYRYLLLLVVSPLFSQNASSASKGNIDLALEENNAMKALYFARQALEEEVASLSEKRELLSLIARRSRETGDIWGECEVLIRIINITNASTNATLLSDSYQALIEVLLRQGLYEDILFVVERVLADFNIIDPSLLLPIRINKAKALLSLNKLEEANQEIDQIKNIIEDANDEKLSLELTIILAQAAFLNGDKQHLKLAEEVLSLSTELGDFEGIAEANSILGKNALNSKKYYSAIYYGRQLLFEGVRMGRVDIQHRGYTLMEDSYRGLDDFEKAYSLSKEKAILGINDESYRNQQISKALRDLMVPLQETPLDNTPGNKEQNSTLPSIGSLILVGLPVLLLCLLIVFVLNLRKVKAVKAKLPSENKDGDIPAMLEHLTASKEISFSILKTSIVNAKEMERDIGEGSTEFIVRTLLRKQRDFFREQSGEVFRVGQYSFILIFPLRSLLSIEVAQQKWIQHVNTESHFFKGRLMTPQMEIREKIVSTIDIVEILKMVQVAGKSIQRSSEQSQS